MFRYLQAGVRVRELGVRVRELGVRFRVGVDGWGRG